MATSVAEIEATFGLAVAVVMFTGAVFLAFVPPATLPKRLLALFLALLGFQAATNVGDVLPSPAWLGVYYDTGGLAALASVAFLAVYPDRVRWRSAPGVLALAATATAVGNAAVFSLARGWTVPPPGSTGNLVAPLLIYVGVLGNGAFFASVALRARGLPAQERRAAWWLASVIVAPLFVRPGAFLMYAVGDAARVISFNPFDEGAIAGDPWGLTLAVHVAARVVVPAALIAFAWRRGTRVPLALAAFGFVTTAFALAGPIDFLALPAFLVALVPCYLVLRDGALGTPSVPPRWITFLAAGAAVAVLLSAVAVSIAVAGDDPLPLAAGVGAGLLLALLAAGLVVLPVGRAWAGQLAAQRVPPPPAPAAAVEPAPVAAPVRTAASGALLFGRFRVVHVLGEGGQGRVLLAHDAKLDRQVVLKAGQSDAAGREARLLAALEHPNVVRVHDVLDAPDGPCVVLEYVPGGTLRARLAKGPLPLAEAAKVLDGVLAGLEAAHARGIVHGDVKPENVLLAADGTPKLADFGSAVEARPGTTASMRPGLTLAYASPEQVRGELPAPRSDLYAAGALLHEMLTGRALFGLDGKDDFALRDAILHKRPELRLAGQPGWVGDLVRRAVAKSPARRFASAAEMRAALAAPREDALR